jgi:hypothetical protein
MRNYKYALSYDEQIPKCRGLAAAAHGVDIVSRRRAARWRISVAGIAVAQVPEQVLDHFPPEIDVPMMPPIMASSDKLVWIR